MMISNTILTLQAPLRCDKRAGHTKVMNPYYTLQGTVLFNAVFLSTEIVSPPRSFGPVVVVVVVVVSPPRSFGPVVVVVVVVIVVVTVILPGNER